MQKLQSSVETIKENMILGNWSCASQIFGKGSYENLPGWKTIIQNPFTTHALTDISLTFNSGSESSNGTWSSSQSYFFRPSNHDTFGSFKILNNRLHISMGGDANPSKSYNLAFSGDKRFTAQSLLGSQDINFTCDKQS